MNVCVLWMSQWERGLVCANQGEERLRYLTYILPGTSYAETSGLTDRISGRPSRRFIVVLELAYSEAHREEEAQAGSRKGMIKSRWMPDVPGASHVCARVDIQQNTRRLLALLALSIVISPRRQ